MINQLPISDADVRSYCDEPTWQWLQDKAWTLVRLGGLHPNDGGFGYGRSLDELPPTPNERRLCFKRLARPDGGASVEVFPDVIRVGIGGIGSWRYTGYFIAPDGDPDVAAIVADEAYLIPFDLPAAPPRAPDPSWDGASPTGRA